MTNWPLELDLGQNVDVRQAAGCACQRWLTRQLFETSWSLSCFEQLTKIPRRRAKSPLGVPGSTPVVPHQGTSYAVCPTFLNVDSDCSNPPSEWSTQGLGTLAV
jgi:hypothetical protein